MEKFFHPYHIVSISPWPLVAGFGVMTGVMGLVKMFVFSDRSLMMLSFILLVLIIIGWWRDVLRESTFQGDHSSYVVSGLMVGMILFITSEVFFFLSFFWAFFHSSLNPVIDLGGVWPPTGISPLNAFQVPLLNTVILLASGVSVTWAHQSILSGDTSSGVLSLMVTWILGVYFLILQWLEYSMSMFGISDSVFGSSFFMSTGFHGFHVIIGTLFLFVMWSRVKKLHFSSSHHIGFECAAWYWHFVDVVWLFLFSVVYWWGAFSMSICTFNFQLKSLNIFIEMAMVVFSLMVMLNFIFYFISMKKLMDLEGVTSYECGFDLLTKSRVSFSYRFFLISILFLIFDVEIALMLPIPYIFWEAGVFFSFFLFVLVLGLCYEYFMGVLTWL